MSEQTIDHPLGQPKIDPNQADPRTLIFANYVDPATLHTVPMQMDFTTMVKKPWRRMGNWTLSDCTCAAAGHMIECWTANTTTEDIVLTREVITAFSALTGYDPETGKNDVGVNYLDALNYWRNTGIGDHKIRAYTKVDHKDYNMVRAAVYLFGGGYLGLNLPNTIIKKDIWEVMPGGLTGDRAPGSFGGHAVNIVAYDETYITCISWGKVKKLTWEFLDTYCYALFAVMTDDYLAEGKTPLGLNLAMLEADLLNIAKHKKTLQKQLNTVIAGSNNGGDSGAIAAAAGTKGGRGGSNAGAAGSRGGNGGQKAGKGGAVAGRGNSNAGKGGAIAGKGQAIGGKGGGKGGRGGSNAGAGGNNSG
ncbi:MAG: hypothetical protein ABI367_11020 [Mucilaginibacter sp.]